LIGIEAKGELKWLEEMIYGYNVSVCKGQEFGCGGVQIGSLDVEL